MTAIINAKRFELPLMRRDSLIEAPSINIVDRSFDIVWTTGARRITWCWDEGSWGGLVEEELDLAGADLSRLNNGGPYFKDHGSWSIDNQLGVHVEGSAVIDVVAKQGRAKIRLSKNTWVDRYWNDIVDKILRQTSVGYQVHKYVVTREEGRLPLYRAAEWTPLENSQVGIGADPGAQVRSADGPTPKLFGCTVEYQSRTVISIPKETQTMAGKKPTIPNQGKKRTMGDDVKTKVKDVLKEYAVAEDKLDECVEKIAVLWPEETATGAGTQSADLAVVAKELGCKEDATPKELAVAAKNLRTLLESTEAQLEEAEEEDEESEFESNEKKGLHRNLNRAGENFARELFDSNITLYREKVAKAKPLDAKPPAANPDSRRRLEDHQEQNGDALATEVEKEEKRLLELNPKLSRSDAYKQAFRNVKEKKPLKAAQ